MIDRIAANEFFPRDLGRGWWWLHPRCADRAYRHFGGGSAEIKQSEITDDNYPEPKFTNCDMCGKPIRRA